MSIKYKIEAILIRLGLRQPHYPRPAPGERPRRVHTSLARSTSGQDRVVGVDAPVALAGEALEDRILRQAEQVRAKPAYEPKVLEKSWGSDDTWSGGSGGDSGGGGGGGE